MDKKKIYWGLNLLLLGIIALILGVVFAYRLISVGTPVEATWGEEIGKYLLMWPIIWAISATICYVPFQMLASYLAKKSEK